MEDLEQPEPSNLLPIKVDGQALATIPDNLSTGSKLTNFLKLRRKPGPPKSDDSRTEKISCRLTKEEKQRGLEYCRRYGTTEAKLLRASYLGAIAQIPYDRNEQMVDHMMQPIEADQTIPAEQKIILRQRIKAVFQRSAMALFIILGGCSNGGLVFEYVFKAYTGNNPLIYHPGEVCIYYPGQMGCTMYKQR